MKVVVKQFIKFSIVGGISTLIDVGIYFLLTRYIGWFGLETHYFYANAISFTTAACNSYLMNKFLTFKDSDTRYFRQILIFAVITLIGLGISQLFVWGGDVLLGNDLIGKLIGVGGTVIWNFLANRFVTFRKRPDTERPQTQQAN